LIKKEFAHLRDEDEVSDRNILRPSLDKIISEVADAFNIDKSLIMKTSRSSTNYARTMAMLIAKRNCSYKLKEIAEFFGVKRYQAISNLTISLSNTISTDSHLMSILSQVVTKLK
jgi:chromosomal replication initiation ATPase DnaA